MARDRLATPNNESWEAREPEVKRKLGQKPEDTDTMTYIGVDHPGIQWLWEDTAKAASNSRYCYQYDEIVSKLGIPGRVRNMDVTVTVNGLKVTSTVKARSQAEAEKIVREKLKVSDG